ncbi:Metal tolerance protein 3 [Pseudocercospora fuligena]|uniref:Metal tolerance protein 3 n=1 Tax=Pseudocercospora fuligena TaxID=685502 RepID=A0A8H6VJG2_9PEZI|nr:Metal tolerance protein 3 [Pseudocercospora fuligena]
MSRRDADLHNSISLRPHPVHLHSERVSREHTPEPGHSRHHPHPPQHQHVRPGTSSAVDKDSPKVIEPVSRPAYHRNSSDSERDDVERQGSLPEYHAEHDPYSLRSGLKDIDDEKAKAKANTKAKRACNPVGQGKDKIRTHKVIKFYEDQNENIERLLKPVADHVQQAKDEQGADALQFKIAVQGSFIANILLAILQVYGAVSSGSLSLFTTMADSIFDPMSNLTLILCNRAVNKVDPRKFPSGKQRLETAGNIAFCFLMTAVSLILIVESIRQLAEQQDDAKFHVPSVVAVGVAFATKVGLFLYCWALRNKYSQIRILWEDHRNDLFINGFGLMTSVLGSKIKWFIDPIGAIVLSLLISFLWLRTAYQEFQLLIGVSADTSFLNHVTYVSMTHDPRVIQLDTVRAWHSGPRIIVEVDIVMDPDLSLRETHDVAEDLQMKLESLPDVERAYVHVDFETTHSPEHFLKKEL